MPNFKLRFSILKSVLFTGGLILAPFYSQAVDLTCTNAIGGGWNFGTAPKSCNVSPLASTPLIKNQYGPILFDDAEATATERQKYLTKMYPVLRDVGRYYIYKRNPAVSAVEVNSFVEGLFTLANQESFWSHYRNGTDGVVRYMRGDSFHGHGMMQVDDRSHTAALKQGKGVDLVYNMMYGLDIFYDSWKKSATASCINSPMDYKNRTRAAWSAYNGGPGSICRWKNKNTAGDQQFLAKYNAKSWLSFVADPKAPVAIDIKCLAEGVRPCALPGRSPEPLPQTPPDSVESVTAYRAGDVVEVVAQFGINLRGLRDGKIISRVPKGTQVDVEEIKVQGADKEVYVKTSFQGFEGYLYGGQSLPQKTYHQWMISAVPMQNSMVSLKSNRPYGFLRDCAGLSCQKKVALIRAFGSAPQMQILKREGSWIFVRSAELDEEGWIADSDVEENRF